MDEFSIERLDNHTELIWDHLAIAGGMSPFVRPGWFRSWTVAFGEESDFRVAVLRRDNVVVAVLPVLHRGRSLRGLTNSETPENDAVATDAYARRMLLDGVLASGYRRVDLDFLPAAGTIASSVRECCAKNGHHLLLWTSRHQPYVDVDGAWDSYERTQLNAKRRRDVARLWRRLAETGTVRFELYDGQQHLDALLDRGFEVESRGWKGRAGTAIVSTPSRALFYRSTARWAADSGILRLAFLSLDTRPIAFCYAMHQNATMYCLKAGYDEAFASYSPGILLLHRLIRYSFDSSELTRLEMLGEDDRYKMEFAHGRTKQIHARIFGGTRALVLERLATDAAHRAKVALRDRLSESSRTRCAAIADW